MLLHGGKDLGNRSEEIQVTGADVLFSRRMIPVEEGDFLFSVWFCLDIMQCFYSCYQKIDVSRHGNGIINHIRHALKSCGRFSTDHCRFYCAVLFGYTHLPCDPYGRDPLVRLFPLVNSNRMSCKGYENRGIYFTKYCLGFFRKTS